MRGIASGHFQFSLVIFYRKLCFKYLDTYYFVAFSETMQPIRQPFTGGYGPGAAGVGQYGPNQYFNVPTQNKFGPLGEWVGYSMGIHEPIEPIEESSEMEVQWIPIQNKRKRFNTGIWAQVWNLTSLHFQWTKNYHICMKSYKV